MAEGELEVRCKIIEVIQCPVSKNINKTKDLCN